MFGHRSTPLFAAAPPAQFNWKQGNGDLVTVSCGGHNVIGINSGQQIWRLKPDNHNWEQLPGAAVSISIASDGTCWCINAGSQLFEWKGTAWQQMPGDGKQISVAGRNDVWLVNNRDELWHYNGTAWSRVPGDCVSISAGEDGSVVVVNRGGQIWRAKVGTSGQFTQMPGGATQVSCHDYDTVAVVNSAGNIYVWNPQANTFQQASGAAKHISVGGHGYTHVWCVNQGQQMFGHRSTPLFAAAPPAQFNWKQGNGDLVTVSCGGHNVIGINSGQQIWRLKADNHNWEQLPGAAVSISIGSDGTCWCINAGSQLFEWKGTAWQQMPGDGKQISVVSRTDVWLVNNRDELWHYNGTAWSRVPGDCVNISAGEDGSVVVVNRGGQLWRAQVGTSAQFTQMPGAATQVSVHDYNTVVCVNAGGQIFAWNPQTNNWQQMSGAAKHVSVGSGGYHHVWCVNSSNQMFGHKH
jgi:hypothetical protein